MNIRLTESKFRNMLSEMVQEVLTEAKMSLEDVYNKYYNNIDKNIFLVAVKSDPTSKRTDDGNIIGIGDYTKWLLNLVRKGSWKPGDSVETKDLLSKFNKLKTRLPVEQRDINRYSSVSELYNTLKPYLNIQSRSENKQGAEKVYEDNEWLIIIPHTKEAACYYGANTKWCTAAKYDNMFNYYNEMGPLYINIHKPTNSKYQFHFESGSFMDEEDEEIQPNVLPWTEGALAYYKSINKYIYIMFDEVDDIDNNGIAVVKLNDKETWFSVEKQDYLFPNKWFDWVSYFGNNGIAIVKLNGKRTWFSLEKQDYLFPSIWFDMISDFDNGIAKVELNNKWTWFSLEKQDYLFPNKWFDYVNDFYNGIAVVKLNGKETWFSLEKQELLFPNQWFNWVSYFNDDDFYDDMAEVKLNNKKYYFTLDGQLLDYDTRQPLSDKELQSRQKPQQVAEMVNRLVRNYRRY